MADMRQVKRGTIERGDVCGATAASSACMCSAVTWRAWYRGKRNVIYVCVANRSSARHRAAKRISKAGGRAPQRRYCWGDSARRRIGGAPPSGAPT